MTIKHLVISGGGPIGMSYLGALEHLHDEGFWKIENIQSIYATSIGTMLAVTFALKYDWETINTYFIDRPWNDLFKLTGKQIVELYTKKGLFDSSYTDKILKPLLEAKDLSLSCSIPGIFVPTFIDDKCLIDGYPLANFPINYCLRDHSEKDDILGFNFICANSDGEKVSNNNTIKDEKNMLDFILNILTNSLNYITNSIKEETIPNIIEIKTTT